MAAALVAVAQSTSPSQKPPDDFLKGVYADDTVDLVQPKVTRSVHPKYTVAAMRAKVQGAVELQAVIDVDGTVARVRVMEGLHPELNAAALMAAKQWTFEPGTLNGKAVPVAVKLKFEFRLH